MEVNKKNRTELKNYFLANSIPTQQQFADLIDACINQAEDGIAKMQGSPVAIAVQGDSAGSQEALHFYTSFEDPNPSWAINLNPWVNTEVPGSKIPGFNLKNGAGLSQFFIQSGNGNVGIGTIEPAARLSVKGRNKVPLIVALSANSGKSLLEVTQEDEHGLLTLHNETGTANARISGHEKTPSFILSKVGIGTTAPEADVHIKKSEAALKITNTLSQGSSHLVLESSTAKSWDIQHNEEKGNELQFVPGDNIAKKLTLAQNGHLTVQGGMTVNGYIKTGIVAFSAYVTENKKHGTISPMPLTATNNFGNHFDNTTFKFKAPVKGLYLFTMTITKWESENDLDWVLGLNIDQHVNAANSGEDEERATLTAKYMYNTYSRTIITVLKEGDLVYIKQKGSGFADNYRSGLEGVLLQALS
jgi:hypothetical protein